MEQEKESERSEEGQHACASVGGVGLGEGRGERKSERKSGAVREKERERARERDWNSPTTAYMHV